MSFKNISQTSKFHVFRLLPVRGYRPMLTVLCLLFSPLAIVPLPVLADEPSFNDRRPFGIGGDVTRSVAVGDINGDGHLDLVTGNGFLVGEQNVVYLNDGTGNFADSGRPFGSGDDNTGSVAVGDVNGDGHLDLVTGNGGLTFGRGEQNMVYLNDGAGNFSGPGRPFGTGSDITRSVALGDVNGDGHLDLVTGNGGFDEGDQNVVYLNDGAGNFGGPGRPFGSGDDNTYGVVLGDVNGDGHLDLVTGNDGQNVIYLNDEEGNFTGDGRPFGTGSDITRSVSLGDVNGDGHLDLVTGNGNTFGRGEQNMVYLNDGTGNFSGPSRPFGSGDDATESVVAGDMNGDGHLDLITGNRGGDFGDQNVVYLNDGVGNFTGPGRPFGFGQDRTNSVAVGDMNGDGHLDLVTGNGGLTAVLGGNAQNQNEQNMVYLNDGAGNFGGPGRPFGTGRDWTNSVAVGDVNGDGHLDLVTGNSGFHFGSQNMVYLNDGAGNFAGPGRPFGSGIFGSGTDLTNSVAVGDVNGDGHLDLVTGNGSLVGGPEQNMVYRNDGAGNFAGPGRPFGTDKSTTFSVALGDVNGDGHLDIVTGNDGQNMVYRNDGAGNFGGPGRPFGTGNFISSVALGDVNGDGHLDIVTGNRDFDEGEQNAVYLNDGIGNFTGPGRPFGFGRDFTWSVAVGDVNGDGHLDLVTGNEGQNMVYPNDGAGNFAGPGRPFGTGDDSTLSAAVGDVNGDGHLDLVTGNGNTSGGGEQNMVYLNDGAGNFAGPGRPFGTGSENTGSVAVGDVNGDGRLDLVTGNPFGQNVVYPNNLQQAKGLANNSFRLTVTRPDPTGNANFFSSSLLIISRTIPIPYTLFDPEGDPVGRIEAQYSLNGGGQWLPAIATTDTLTTNLGTTRLPSGQTDPGQPSESDAYLFFPLVVGAETLQLVGAGTLQAATHVYTWDTFASGFFGQSDNVVVRMLAYSQPLSTTRPTTYRYFNSAAGPIQWPYASAATFPFRVRGTQVRVLQGTGPAANALVYRLPAGQTREAQLFGTDSEPFRTNNQGYLGGRGRIEIGDRLVALLPLSLTPAVSQYVSDTLRLYHSSAAPLSTGLNAFTVTEPGVQQLVVSSDNPLLLFDLDVALEWDARKDAQFLSQLVFDLQRSSELLFDWSNGQIALGDVMVYHDAPNVAEVDGYQPWVDAHIRVYATNRLRPSASQGGIVNDTFAEIISATKTITYTAGQVRMGAVWNRYGESSGSLGEDWPRALAHELGHYLLFLDDNYLGLNDAGVLITIPPEACPGVMNNPYSDVNSEFHPDIAWRPGCSRTLSEQETGRSDWETIQAFYPMLKAPSTAINDPAIAGPSGLPLAVTQVSFQSPITPAATLDVPIFFLSQDGQAVQAGSRARAILYQDDQLIDLGRAVQDQVFAYGARPGDELCVYELSAGRLGCETVTVGDDQLNLTDAGGWPPEVILSPVNSTTLHISVTGSIDGVYMAKLYPVDGPAPSPITLTNGATGTYAGTLNLDQAALEGYVRVQVETGGGQHYEVATDYALGGNPVHRRGRRVHRRGRRVHRRGRRAPATSPDGQVTVFGDQLARQQDEEWIFTVQAATALPNAPSWTTVVGQAYRILATDNAPNLNGASISFQYLGEEVPAGEESFLRIYFWDGTAWTPLPTELDTFYNVASAAVKGPGLYALMSSIEIPLTGPGWNNFAYTVQATRVVSKALASIDGNYSVVFGFDSDVAAGQEPWRVHGPNAPSWVNDLTAFEFGKGYWIHLTSAEGITLYLGGNDNVTAASLDNVVSLPAVFYGTVLPSAELTPTAGMTVTALISGNQCGVGQTRDLDGQIAYVVKVAAEKATHPGCGGMDRNVAFEVAGKPMSGSPAASTTWDNTLVQEVLLQATIPTVQSIRIRPSVVPAAASTGQPEYRLYLPGVPGRSDWE